MEELYTKIEQFDVHAKTTLDIFQNKKTKIPINKLRNKSIKLFTTNVQWTHNSIFP